MVVENKEIENPAFGQIIDVLVVVGIKENDVERLKIGDSNRVTSSILPHRLIDKEGIHPLKNDVGNNKMKKANPLFWKR